MSPVNLPDGKVTLFALAKGSLSNAAMGVQEPARLPVVQERQNTLLASKKANVEPWAAMTVLVKPFGHWPKAVVGACATSSSVIWTSPPRAAKFHYVVWKLAGGAPAPKWDRRPDAVDGHAARLNSRTVR
ncbi:hypothetical protein GCM10010272_53510 [Streptomyces lateritius]|nr:hypothetical protein GCM10010272_53510 [Streptomyces lateritius]